MSDTNTNKPKTRHALKMAMKDRQVLAMLLLGLASGLPYAAVGGTLNAWLSTVDVKPVAIGLLSWAFLAYAFKFMWASAFQSRKTPFNLNIGPRRFWMFVFLVLITLGLFVLSFSNPPNDLARIGLISVLIAVFSASFDIVLAAWRIEVARDDTHLDILSTVEQFGYRIASLIGGFVALLLADQIGWRLTFLGGTALMGLTVIGVLLAKPTQVKETSEAFIRQGQNLTDKQRRLGTVLILMGWAVGFYLIASFMHGALTDPDNHSARDFIRYQGPIVVGVTVIWLGVVSAGMIYLNTNQPPQTRPAEDNGVLSILYQAIVEPMMELIGRLRWAVILVLAVVLSYRFTDLIWGSFAYPFYLGENYGALGHSLTEVGFASKLMGVIATILGIALGGLAMLRFGRMPVFFVGAVLAASTNLLFADLAIGAPVTDKFLGLSQLDDLFAVFQLDIRMARLTTVIFFENIAVGLASAASIAYLSSIVNKDYAAVQYALLVSLVMLLGVLGRPTIGAIIESDGFAKAFIICAALGGVASVLALIEWIRVAKTAAHNPAKE
ncbi:PAT family beta-lactamase induction signal transducer AmpG [Litorimonas taeanensis]|uniref:PAT family beta-lactamase induction signal transducer AmpG n=2 Tax=Litorimonas taeanensis TaxID=568099 RepID=A0A420WEV6_9PROT|nr:PAT family beta-lactamase induction signal transducer AmpG [Litorimonas taeanensis]